MKTSLALLGLPHAGKTSWLGRLWVSVDAGTGRLRQGGFPNSLADLNRLSDWLYDAAYPNHSPVQGAPEFTVDLCWEGSHGSRSFNLHISDYSGENLNQIYKDRDGAWGPAWEQRAHASGLAIFIRPDRLRLPRASRLEPSTPTCDEAQATLGPGLMPDQDARGPDDADVLPTGVALVELLQLLRAARGLAMGEWPDPAGYRVAVILSAWDAVLASSPNLSPSEFVHQKLGLLDDFLATNYAPDGIRIFGLSTTGGDLNDRNYKVKYQIGQPEDFGFVCWDDPSGVRQDSDITLPLGWLLEGDAALP